MLELNILKLQSFINFLLGQPHPHSNNYMVVFMGVAVASLGFRYFGILFDLKKTDIATAICTTLVSLFVVMASPLILGEYTEEPLHAVVASGLFVSIPFIKFFMGGKYRGALVTWFYSMTISVFSMHLTQKGMESWNYVEPPGFDSISEPKIKAPPQKAPNDLPNLITHTLGDD